MINRNKTRSFIDNLESIQVLHKEVENGPSQRMESLIHDDDMYNS